MIQLRRAMAIGSWWAVVMGLALAGPVLAAAPGKDAGAEAQARAADGKAGERVEAATPETKVEPFVRVVELDGGARVQLQTAARTYRREGAPEIHLVGAVHIGLASFYQELQEFLDGHDVVLYEGVKPPGGATRDPGLEADASDEDRVKLTRNRVLLAATIVEMYRRDKGELPASLAALSELEDQRVSVLVERATTDAWGRELAYARTGDEDPDAVGFTLASLGGDGAEGGEGADADIAYADMPRIDPDELPGSSRGIQQQLADAFGLVFQLDHMDHTGANWRNSDMSVDQVQARLEAAGADGGMLFSLLDGSSFQAKLAGFVLRIIGASPTLQTMMQVMLIDILGRAEDMFETLPGEMGRTMNVILHDRNEVVLADLRDVLEEEGVESVGIIYGAGHLRGLEEGLRGLGFTPVEDRWFTAMDVDITKAGMSVAQAQSMRRMMATTIESQLKAQRREAERERRREERRRKREAEKAATPAEREAAGDPR